MDDLRAIFDQLEGHELDYVFERSRQTSDAAAFRAAGISKSSFYEWPADRRAQLNAWAQDLKRQSAMRARLVLDEAAEEAARKIVELMGNSLPRIALEAARDVLDRTTGKPSQAVDVTSGGAPLTIEIKWPNAQDGNGNADDDLPAPA
jgi:hypothetical protein